MNICKVVSLLVAFLLPCIKAYKTVVLVHGLNSDGGEFSTLKPRIEKAHEGSNVVELNYDPTFNSLDPIPVQLNWFNKAINKILETVEDEIHLICHSQGGLVCLGYLEFTENHRVNTFISLSSPLFGQYGIPKDVTDVIPIFKWFKHMEDEAVSELVYDVIIQNAISVANYWRDPRPSIKEKYESTCIYLPVIMNDPAFHLYNATEAAQRKQNFLKLKHLVLAGGPDDETIKPWQSPLFGYFEGDPRDGHVINMTDQKVFKEDWFGLRKLNETKRLHSYVMAGINHNGWVADESVFQNIIEPWLT